MTIEHLNPEGLPKPEQYRQVAAATGARTVFLAGQVARTADGAGVGAGDLAAQVEQAYMTVATALAAVGGSFDDVAKLTLYIVDWSEEKMAALGAGRRACCCCTRRRSRQADHLDPRHGPRRAGPTRRSGRRRRPGLATSGGPLLCGSELSLTAATMGTG